MTSRLDREALAALPCTFRYSQARSMINERRIRDLLRQDLITRLGRGLYRKAGCPGDEDLIEIAAQRSRATLCLRTALTRHDLIDDIPAELDIALPRGIRPPAVTSPVAWHHFNPDTFEIGREAIGLDETTSIGIYSPERSIIDAFRLRENEGQELGHEALRRWLRTGGQPSALIQMSTRFHKGTPALRHALEVLL